jgi:hypothetical protein
MAKTTRNNEWFNRIGIEKTCAIVAYDGGAVTLTKTVGGMHTLWIYDYPLLTDEAITVRRRYAEHLHDHWLAKYYR